MRGTFESLLWTSDAEQDLPGTWKAIKSILSRLWKATKSVPGSFWKATKLILGHLCKARKSIVTKQPPVTGQPPVTEHPPVTEQPPDMGHRPWLIYGFIAFTAILSVMCNLMGPAVAVLILPTLQWIDTRPVGDLNFVSIGAGEPPQMAADWETYRYFSSNTYCTEDDFQNLTFSCAANPYASKLDSWIGTYIAAGDYIDGLTQEWSVKFRVNQTFSAPVLGSDNDQHSSAITWWTPSRQVLSSLDDDRTMVEMISQGYSDPEMDGFYSEGIRNQLPLDSPNTYVNYNNSLRLTLQRRGPVLGAIVQCTGRTTYPGHGRAKSTVHAVFVVSAITICSTHRFTKPLKRHRHRLETSRNVSRLEAAGTNGTKNSTLPSLASTTIQQT
jgi:hypothetical protein